MTQSADQRDNPGARLRAGRAALSLLLCVLSESAAPVRVCSSGAPPAGATHPRAVHAGVDPAAAAPVPRTSEDPGAALDAALSAGWRARADSLQAARFHNLPIDFRARMSRLLEPSQLSDAEARGLRTNLELRADAYRVAFHQTTLGQSLALLNRLRPAERREWVHLEGLRARGDTLFLEQAWGEADSLSRLAAIGLERLGDSYGAGRAWTRSGACAEMRGELDRAVAQGRRALALLERADAPFEIVRVLHNLATALETLGRFEEAEAGLERALTESRRVPSPEREFLESSARSLLAAIQIRRGRYPDALEHYRRSRELSARMATPAAVADDLRGMGHLHSLLGQLDLALAEYDTALVMAERSEDSQLAGLCLSDRGDVLVELGRLDAAAASYRMALARHADVRDERSAGETLFRSGRLESLRGNHRAGRAAIDSALAIATRIDDAANIGAYLAGLGEISLAVARHAEAHGYFTRALGQARRIGQREQEQDALRSLGRLDELLGRPEAARQRYQEALALARSTGRHGRVVTANLALAELDLAAGRPEEALLRSREAGRAARGSGAAGLELAVGELAARADLARGRLAAARQQIRTLRSNPRLSDNPPLHFEVARTAARIERRAGNRLAALADYREAALLLEEMAEAATAAEIRAGLQSGRYEIYRELVGLLLELGRTTEAFEWADRSRARALVERLAAAESPRLPPAPDSRAVGRERRRLQVLARSLRDEEARGGRPDALRTLRQELAAAQRDYGARLAWLESGSAGPRRPDAPLLPALQARLEPGVAMIEYFRTDSTLVAFIIRRDRLSIVRLPGGAADLEPRIRTFRDALEADFLHPETPRDWRTPGHSLYQDLWRPLAGELGGITLALIAPEGALRLLPFAALVVDSGAPGVRPRLLADELALAITPSGAALALAPRAADVAPRNLVAVAAGSRRRGAALKSVEREAREVAKRFPGSRSQILAGAKATEPGVVAVLPEADWIHFACHAHLNVESPRFSWLELTPARDTDGRLEVFEVETLNLRARLVTLSACETAIESGSGAPFPPGEELVGMMRAFLTAGAEAVVASLWPVPDAEVGELMAEFYTELARNPAEPARALNAAQRHWLGRGQGRSRTGHPYLGTAFILVGRPD